jgi:two-component system cell cycle sensor histidine kinase/response regulator CckA
MEHWNALVHPEEQKEMLDYFLNHVVAGKNPFNKEYRIIRERDGQTRWVWGLGELVFDQLGIPVKMIGTIQDITERNILQNQLLQSQKVQSIGILAGGIAHDFNNILAIILAYTSRLSRGKFDEKQLVSSIEAINHAVERGAALVRQILTFARQTEISFKPLPDSPDIVESLC